MTDHAALRAAGEDFLVALGGVDVVIANAGVSRGTLTEYAEDLAVFERVVATNVTATVATFTPFIGAMKKQAAAGSRDCRLVGIASVAGIRGLPGSEAYSASKAAVISYCESLRVELKRSGIRFTVPRDLSLLEALEQNNVDTPSLCRGGACGQCELEVCDATGAIVHHDVYLSPEERASGRKIMPCVSRLDGGCLVLNH